MGYFIVASDLHIGEKRCSLGEEKFQDQFVKEIIEEYDEIEELILIGDILELNLSAINSAIDGTPGYFKPEEEKVYDYQGFRALMKKLRGINIGKIVYLPGNHDYHILQALNTSEREIKPLQKGQLLDPEPMLRGSFPTPFLKGILPSGLKKKFSIEYPDYTITTSGQEKILLTHGHHLDPSQALLGKIEDLAKRIQEGENRRRALLEFESRITAYQGIAHWQAKNYDLRRMVETGYNILGMFSKWWDKRKLKKVKASKMRREPISSNLMRRIELYLTTFVDSKKPSAFIFGHTHDPDLKWNKNRTLLVANTGSFLVEPKRSKDFVGTYVAIDNSVSLSSIVDRITIKRLSHEGSETLFSKKKGIRTV
jgi:UDP-2,3-diacylglucosamine pyrophosphatase LpxH